MKKFTNFSDEVFDHANGNAMYNSVPYSFAPGQSVVFPEDYQVELFAKKLVDREMQKQNLNVDHHTRAQFMAKALQEDIVVSPELQNFPDEVKVLNLETKTEEIGEKKKAGRPRKEEQKEEEFSDLKS
jgi:hypothetical protein